MKRRKIHQRRQQQPRQLDGQTTEVCRTIEKSKHRDQSPLHYFEIAQQIMLNLDITFSQTRKLKSNSNQVVR